MVKIVGISGSLRRHSYNTGLLRAAAENAPAGCSIEIISIADVPLYNGDVEESDGIPPSVVKIKDAIAGADGLLLSTPEYNNSIPGVFKNAIDWASRPPADAGRVWKGRKVALMGASPGNWGTILSQNAWLPVLHTLGAELWNGGRLMIPGAGKIFDGEGNLTDEATRERLAKFVAGFLASLG